MLSTKNLTTGGLLTALTLILLYLTRIIESNTLTLLTLASFMVPLGLMRCNLKTAFLIYISSSVLALLLTPLSVALLYILFFGIYGIIKYYAEKMPSYLTELGVKLVFFNSMSILITYGFKLFLGYSVFQPIDLLVKTYIPQLPTFITPLFIWLITQIVFMIFDYALTLLITFYKDYLKRA